MSGRIGSALKPGWRWPPNAAKAHYFSEDGRSLCGRWAFFSPDPDSQEFLESSDNCKVCVKKRRARLALLHAGKA